MNSCRNAWERYTDEKHILNTGTTCKIRCFSGWWSLTILPWRIGSWDREIAILTVLPRSRRLIQWFFAAGKYVLVFHIAWIESSLLFLFMWLSAQFSFWEGSTGKFELHFLVTGLRIEINCYKLTRFLLTYSLFWVESVVFFVCFD